MKTEHLLLFVAGLMLSLDLYAQDVRTCVSEVREIHKDYDSKNLRTDEYVRLTDLSQLEDGSSVIFAARHDTDETSFYAMPNEASGKPEGVIFTSAIYNGEYSLPTEITDDELDFCWTIDVDNGVYTFINTDGDMIGYGSSGTDFVKNGTNSTWTIEPATSGEGTTAPHHNAFIITNVGATNRSFAFRKYNNSATYEKFAPYTNSESNMNGSTYYFFIDIFMKNSETLDVVSDPYFSPEAGTYQSTQYVTIESDTENAIIYYTVDGTDPNNTSEIYVDPIEVSNSVIIRAIAVKDGFVDSEVVEAEYIISEPVAVTFYNNGVVMDVYTIAQGSVIGELPAVVPPDGYSFKGWTEDVIETYSHVSPSMISPSTIIDTDLLLYAVFAIDYNNWIETDIDSFTSSDCAVIAVSKDDNYYAMSQILGSNGQPTAIELEVDNGIITGNINDTLQWNIACSDASFTIFPKDITDSWLYCLSGSNNNSVRIGDNIDNKIFELRTVEINEVIYPDYLYNISTSRFVGVYFDDDVALDWRAYKLTASGAFPTNIKNQTYHFYKHIGSKYYCTNIEIPDSQTITQDITWCNVSLVNPIVIEKDAILTIEGAITNTNANNLVIKDGGQLIHNNHNVVATFEKEIGGYNLDDKQSVSGWFTIGSPMVDSVLLTDVDNLMPEDCNYDLYRYDEPTREWQNVKDITNNFTTFDAGRGYLYANEYDATLSFVGELNSETQNYHLTKTDDTNLSGFHLISNPYTHNIYKGVNAAIDNPDLAVGYYVITGEGAWQPMIYDNAILPGQGVLIKTIKENDLIIEKTSKMAEGESSMAKSGNKGMIAISVQNESYKDMAYISFEDGYGLDKVPHQNQDIPMIYVSVNNSDYAISTIGNDTLQIPLSFEAKTMGEYTISVTTEEMEIEELFLIDKFTGTTTNVLMEDYAFIAKNNDDPSRFIISFRDNSFLEDGVIDTEETFAYINNGELIVKDLSGTATIIIYDALGNCIYRNNCCESMHKVSMNMLCIGSYIIQKIDDTGVKIQKIIFD